MTERRSVLDGPLPPAFERWVVVLAPGGRRDYRPAEWRDALVSVDLGELALEGAGPPRRLCAGALLSLAGLPLVAISNPGCGPTVLVVVRRRVVVKDKEDP